MQNLAQICMRLVVAVVIALVAVPCQPDVVVCLGENGHLSLEMPHRGHCDDDAHRETAHARVNIGTLAHTDECCGACVDMPLGVSTMGPCRVGGVRVAFELCVVTQFTDCFSDLLVPYGGLKRFALYRSKAPLGDATLRALRSVVLRT